MQKEHTSVKREAETAKGQVDTTFDERDISICEKRNKEWKTG